MQLKTYVPSLLCITQDLIGEQFVLLWINMYSGWTNWPLSIYADSGGENFRKLFQRKMEEKHNRLKESGRHLLSVSSSDDILFTCYISRGRRAL